MAEMNETPRGNRVRIAFFGLRNVGKSTLVNAFAGQEIAIVSDTPGTTTDPVSKAMEILPLGPCMITDTAGLDDEGELGRQRVEKTLGVLAATDIAVWVGEGLDKWRDRVSVPVVEYRRGDSVEALKGKIASMRLGETAPGLLDGLVARGDRVVCVCPIDSSAPKGRLILPQVQVLRDCLDRHVPAIVCQPEELAEAMATVGEGSGNVLVVTDSQAFGAVSRTLGDSLARFTSFSILFARQKGDIAAYKDGLSAIGRLMDGDTVLVAEGCTHHRQCEDIGTVKIPKALAKLSGGKRFEFRFASGGSFDFSGASLVVQCGGCMLTRRETLRRISLAREAGVPIVNYGMVLAKAVGVEVERCAM